MEGMDHVNEDSFMTDESIEEQRETTATGTDEGEALYDPAEITSVEESQESQIETAPQLEVSSSCNFLWNTKCCKMHIFCVALQLLFFSGFCEFNIDWVFLCLCTANFVCSKVPL